MNASELGADFKSYLEKVLKGEYKHLYLKKGVRSEGFDPDFTLCDSSGTPHMFFNVKNHRTRVSDDIRSWKATYMSKGRDKEVKMVLAYYDCDGWHFLDADDKEWNVKELLKSIDKPSDQGVNATIYYVVGSFLGVISLFNLSSPFWLSSNAIAPLTMETVVMLSVSALFFVLPDILSRIVEVDISLSGLCIVSKLNDKKDIRK